MGRIRHGHASSGPVQECRSRYAHKPALSLDGREIARLEGPGVINLRISQKGGRKHVMTTATSRHPP
jgi:hypothetical protein